MSFIRRTAVLAVAALAPTIFAFGGTPAYAEEATPSAAEVDAWKTLADAATIAPAVGIYVDEDVEIPLVITHIPTPGGDVPLPGPTTCVVRLSLSAGYSKPAFSAYNQEYANARASHNCGGAINNLNLDAYVADKGAAFFSSVHQASQNGSGQNNVYANAFQQVALYSFPADYHAFGSVLNWSARLNISYNSGYSGAKGACLAATAIYPGNPSKSGCNI